MNLEVSRNRLWKAAGRHLLRVFVGVIGMLVLLIGIVMLVTPGPAIVVIPMGLGILATQFAWARRLLQEFRERAKKLTQPADKSDNSKNPPTDR